MPPEPEAGRPPDWADSAVKTDHAVAYQELNVALEQGSFGRHVRFFNFGYRPLAGEAHIGPVLGPSFPNRDSAQLLFQLLGDVPVEGRRVLEIGCGRAGNLGLLQTLFGANPIHGLDLAPQSLAFGARHLQAGAGLLTGDAERLPIKDASIPIVLSVETAHAYPNVERFLREVARVLDVGGWFLYTDLIHAASVEPYVAALGRLGLELRHRRDITANVAASRNVRAERQALALSPDGRSLRGYVATKETRPGRSFEPGGDNTYVLARFRKVAEVKPPEEPLLDPDTTERTRARSREVADLLLAEATQR